VLKVHRSGFYAWLKKPLSNRAVEDQRLLKLIMKSYNTSNGVYGSPRIFLDLRDEGETCGLNRIARLMQPNMASKLIIDALSMAAIRRKPKNEVLVHSDQGSQYGSNAWHKACEALGFKPSMSRRGNCWDNAVAESFFGSLKKERVRKKIYQTMDEARNDLLDFT